MSKVGRVKAYRINVGLARQAGESLFDVCDAHSQGMHETHVALFDPEIDELKDDIRDRFDAVEDDVLVLDYVLLKPKWRGLRLGLLAARKMVDLLGGGCGLVVSDIYPLCPEADEFAKVPAGWVPKHEDKGGKKDARRKLRRHFKRMGFRRIAGTPYHGLSMTQVVPTSAELLKPERRSGERA